MVDMENVLTGNRNAVRDIIVAAEKSADTWTTPRAPGKWSPSQVVEHVARALEESAHVVAGEPSKFPIFPSFIRPIVRGMFFNRVLKKGAFPNAKTNKPLDPERGPEDVTAGRVRLETAHAKFDMACRAKMTDGSRIESTIFGKISVADYARFQELHTRHHCKQMPGGG